MTARIQTSAHDGGIPETFEALLAAHLALLAAHLALQARVERLEGAAPPDRDRLLLEAWWAARGASPTTAAALVAIAGEQTQRGRALRVAIDRLVDLDLKAPAMALGAHLARLADPKRTPRLPGGFQVDPVRSSGRSAAVYVLEAAAG